MLSAGDPAPDFSSLRPFDPSAPVPAERPLLLAIFKISCPVCQFAFPFLERLHQLGFKVAAISQDDARGTAEFHEELGITLPTLIEPRGYAVSRAFQIDHVPSMFLIGDDGKIADAETGFSKSFFERMAALAGVDGTFFRAGERVPSYKPG